MRYSIVLALLGCCGVSVNAFAEEPKPAVIARIEPGTRIDVKALPERTSVVFRSLPKLTSGDVDKVRESIVKALESFTTVVLVQTEPNPAQPDRFRRKAHSIGVGMPGENGDLIVTKATAKGLGVALGFFENRVLSERDKELNTVVSPGATPTMAVFDFSANYLRDGRRFPIVLRYFALVDVKTGKIDTIHCVFESTPDGLKLIDGSFQRLAPNHVMDWPLHVDATKTTLGAPNADAFSVTQLPQGTPLEVDAEVKAAATAPAFDAESASGIERQLREALNQARARSPRSEKDSVPN